MDGFLLINKPPNWTSHDVVAYIRKLTGAKKVGHAGTLDPMATGLLIIGIGRATKELGEMLGLDKEYEAAIRLGARSDTDDRTGTIVETEQKKPPAEQEVRDALQRFVGTIEQLPPVYSAKKVGGKKMYELARRGLEVPRKPVKVTIHEIELQSFQWPLVTLRVRVSSGTYIRALARDVGESLGIGGLLESLVRTRIGPYHLKDASDARDLHLIRTTKGYELTNGSYVRKHL